MTTRWYSRVPLASNAYLFCEPHVSTYFRANVFHVCGRDADLVIDFGLGLMPLTLELGLPAGKPAIGVATHVHLDHVGCFHEFAERLGHVAEADAFATMPDWATFADEFRRSSDALTHAPYTGWDQACYQLRPAALTRELRDGDTIDLGDEVYEVLHLPGHSPGSIGLLGRKSGMFFSGDAIHGGRLFDDIPGSDRAAYRATMRRLMELDMAMVHGGHGPAISKDRMHEIAGTYLRRSEAS